METLYNDLVTVWDDQNGRSVVGRISHRCKHYFVLQSRSGREYKFDNSLLPKSKGMTHKLKTEPPFYGLVDLGVKTCEVRRNDRDFKAGDVLELAEYHAVSGYTGRVCCVEVTHVLHGVAWGLNAGYVAMSIKKIC